MAVTKEVKETIEVTIDEVFRKMNSISWLERQKAMKDEAFKNTEKILYCYNVLQEHVESEEQYLEECMADLQRKRAKSIVLYSTAKSPEPDVDQIIEDRKAAYRRSKSDAERIEKALKSVRAKKGYPVIEYRYLKRKDGGDVYTYEEIAELLAGTDNYSENLNEKTVRNYKNSLVRDISVFLFGSDAI